MKQGKELRNNAFYLVCNEYLVAIELYLVALKFYIVLHAWEIQNAGQVEWIVNIQVNPEQRFVVHWEECTVELLVVLVFQFSGSFCP